jgi:chromate transporter
MSWEQIWSLLWHFVSLSLLAIGGAVTTAPEMHRYLVGEQRWISDGEFSASIAIAQAAPGPNVLFIALLGWQVGLNLGGTWWAAATGLAVTMLGIMLPSTTLTLAATRWLHRNRNNALARAFSAGLAPISIALLMATATLLVLGYSRGASLLSAWPLWLLTGGAFLLVWRTKLHLLWMIAAGAVVGALGWV